MSSILNQARNAENERKKKFKEQQDRFYAEVARRQQATGSGAYGKYSEEYLKTKEGKRVAKEGDKQGFQRGDVREQAKVNAEVRVEAERAAYNKKTKRSLSTGQRNPVTGERTLSVSGARPTVTEKDVQAEMAGAKQRVIDRRIREGRQLPPGYLQGRSNADAFVNYRLLKEEANRAGYDINQAKSRTRYVTRDGQSYAETTTRAKYDKRKVQAPPQTLGISIVGTPPASSPQAPLSVNITQPQMEEDFLAQKRSEGLYFTGVKVTDPVTGETSYEFEDRKARDAALREASTKEKILRANAIYIGYSAQPQYENGAITGFEFIPRKGVDQFAVLNTAGTDVTAEFLRGEISAEQYSKLSFRNTNPESTFREGYKPKDVNSAQGVLTEFGTGAITRGEDYVNPLIGKEDSILGGKKQTAIGEAERVLTEYADYEYVGPKRLRGYAQTKVLTEESKKKISTGLVNVGGAIAENPARFAGETGTEAAIFISTLGAGKLVGVGAKATGKIIAKLPSAFKTTPKVFAKVDKELFLGQGRSNLPTDKVTLTRSLKAPEVDKNEIFLGQGRESLSRLFGTNTARGGVVAAETVKDKPIKASPNEAKQAAIEDIYRATGEKIDPRDVKVVGTKTVKQGERYDTVPVKSGEKPTSYEVVSKDGTQTFAVVTKKGVTVTTRSPLDITQASKAVGQRVSRTGQSFENVKPTNPDDLFATDYTKYETSEAKGLKKATSNSYGTRGETVEITSPTGERRTLISEGEGVLRTPKTISTDTLTFNVKGSVSASQERRITESIKEQAGKYHRTPENIENLYYKPIENDPIIRAKVAKQERILSKPRNELASTEEKLSSIDNDLRAIESERASLESAPTTDSFGIAVNEETLAARQARIEELNARGQVLGKQRSALSSKRDTVKAKIDFLTKRYSLKRHDVLGARQRLGKKYADQSKSPNESLAARGITKENAAGFSGITVGPVSKGGQLSFVDKVVPSIGAPIKARKIQEAFIAQKEVNADARPLAVLSIGGNVADYTNRQTLGLGGKTGAERKRRKSEPPESEIIFLTTPKSFGPANIARPLGNVDERQRGGTGIKNTQKSIFDDIYGTRTDRKLVNVTQQVTRPAVVEIPIISQTGKTNTKEDTKRGSIARTVPFTIVDDILTPKVASDISQGFRQDTRQTYRQSYSQKKDDFNIPRPRDGFRMRPLAMLGGGGGVFGGGGKGKRGETGISSLAVANLLFPSLSVKGAGEQAGGAERLLSLSAKPRKKGKGKRKRSILEI